MPDSQNCDTRANGVNEYIVQLYFPPRTIQWPLARARCAGVMEGPERSWASLALLRMGRPTFLPTAEGEVEFSRNRPCRTKAPHNYLHQNCIIASVYIKVLLSCGVFRSAGGVRSFRPLPTPVGRTLLRDVLALSSPSKVIRISRIGRRCKFMGMMAGHSRAWCVVGRCRGSEMWG